VLTTVIAGDSGKDDFDTEAILSEVKGL